MSKIDIIKSYPLVIVSLVITLTCVAFTFFRGDRIATLEARETALYEQIRLIEKNKINVNGLNEDLASLKEVVGGIEERLFDPEQRAVNTRFFYSYEDEFDMVITKVAEDATEDPVLGKKGPNELKQYSVLTYYLSVKTDFHEFLRFLHTLHTDEPIMRVSEFQLFKVGGKDSESLEAQINVRVLAKAE